jgi:hypothetical protein
MIYVSLVSKPDAGNTENMRAGLSRDWSSLLPSLSERGKTIFKIGGITTELKRSYNYAKVLANNLARKKWILVLRRGI